MKFIKNSMLIALCITMVTLSSCTDEEVAVGAGIVAIGAATVAIGASSNDHHHRRRHYRRHRRRHHHYYYGINYNQSDSYVENSILDVEKVSSKFNLSHSDASTFVEALERSQAGDTTALKTIGFSSEDIYDMSKFKVPSSSSLERVSLALNQQRYDTREMLQTIVQESKKQAKDINSYLWKSCMAVGKWKTPQNNNCQKTFWKGCTPETGATSCVPAVQSSVSFDI